MSLLVLYKLLAIFITVALGWFAGRMRWLGEASSQTDPARMLSNAAFFIFIPALMFRTTARVDLQALPWTTLLAYFVPALMIMLGVYAGLRWAQGRTETAPAAQATATATAATATAARPAVRAFAVTFGNSVQVGIPLAAALFGEAGLGIHITLVSLHALVVLTVITVLVELDIARSRAARSPAGAGNLWRTLSSTARSAVIHPVVLPVLAGLVWNLAGLPWPDALDETFKLLSSAVAPLCLVLIGLSLAYSGVGGTWHGALVVSALKLLALPALALVVAHWGFGLTGLALQVVVVMAALPTGSNPLIFAQRYRTLEGETTAVIVLSTLGFVVTLPMWLAILARLA